MAIQTMSTLTILASLPQVNSRRVASDIIKELEARGLVIVPRVPRISMALVGGKELFEAQVRRDATAETACAIWDTMVAEALK